MEKAADSLKPGAKAGGSIADRIAAMKAQGGGAPGGGIPMMGMPGMMGMPPKKHSEEPRDSSIHSADSEDRPVSVMTAAIINPEEAPPIRKRSVTALEQPKGGIKAAIEKTEGAISEEDSDRDSEASRPSSVSMRVKSTKMMALQGNLGGLNMQAMLGGGMPRGMPMPGMSLGMGPRGLIRPPDSEDSDERYSERESSARFAHDLFGDEHVPLKPRELDNSVVAERATMKKKRRPQTRKAATEDMDGVVEAVKAEDEAKDKKKRGLFGFGKAK
jgi:hypothetical protein